MWYLPIQEYCWVLKLHLCPLFYQPLKSTHLSAFLKLNKWYYHLSSLLRAQPRTHPSPLPLFPLRDPSRDSHPPITADSPPAVLSDSTVTPWIYTIISRPNKCVQFLFPLLPHPVRPAACGLDLMQHSQRDDLSRTRLYNWDSNSCQCPWNRPQTPHSGSQTSAGWDPNPAPVHPPAH